MNARRPEPHSSRRLLRSANRSALSKRRRSISARRANFPACRVCLQKYPTFQLGGSGTLLDRSLRGLDIPSMGLGGPGASLDAPGSIAEVSSSIGERTGRFHEWRGSRSEVLRPGAERGIRSGVGSRGCSRRARKKPHRCGLLPDGKRRGAVRPPSLPEYAACARSARRRTRAGLPGPGCVRSP